MTKKTILVLGSFDWKNNRLSGQTVKTRSVYQLLKENSSKNVDFFDFQKIKANPLSFIIFLWKLAKGNDIVFLPAYNSLKFLFPALYIFALICHKKIHYFVIGGWLSDFISKNKKHKKLLKKIDGIYIENSAVKNILEKKWHFRNIHLFPNFRFTTFKYKKLNKLQRADKNTLKLVFMSRITKAKGLDMIYELANRINNWSKQNKVIIDFYGPISNSDSVFFKEKLLSISFVCYKGILEPETIHERLSQYDLLILPTHYEGEGFPGAIIDAYIAHVPVLITRWKNLPEFVTENKTGFIIDVNDIDSFEKIIKMLTDDKNVIEAMRKYAGQKSKEYSPEQAWNIIEKVFE